MDPVTSVVLHGNQVELFISDQAVFLWDLRRDGHVQLQMPELSNQEFVTNLAIHPSANLLAGVTNRGGPLVAYYFLEVSLVSSFRLFVHNESYPIVSLHLQNYIERPTETITRLSLEDGGKRLLHKSYGLSCRYSPDGRTLVTTGADNMIHILDAHDSSLKYSIDAGCEWNWSSAFTCDSRILFTGGADNRVKLWDMDSGQMVMKYDGHTKSVTAICISDVPSTPPCPCLF
ncbi:unnamed protein product [Heligmosomoides polygyrus]|uniref:Target of rapamycin complex subunit lst8 n=1 Tax=Heligmosomoides polygyrus TaxID=6339 RepID=A0A3P8DZJ6_HELPZ|nr:unnamed protein product [Heligmosomoides polygyrus]